MPFWLCDVHLLINDRRLHNLTATKRDLQQVNFVALEFTNQINGVRGEFIGLGQSGHASRCPVHALTSRVTHLCIHGAPSPCFCTNTSMVPGAT
jgi:hypothetical protein